MSIRFLTPATRFIGHITAGTTDGAHELYLARGADRVGTPDPNETEAVRWIPLGEIPRLIADGAITGATTIIGAQHVLLTAGPSLPQVEGSAGP
ncbi:MAG: hypothetical protein ACRDNT_29275 [Streptosporangiaceae bacterium]